MTWMLLKDWIPTKTRSITPLTEWPLLCRISPPDFTSCVSPAVFRGASCSPRSSPEPRTRAPHVSPPRVRTLLSPRKCLTLTRQPVVSQRDCFFPYTPAVCTSRIHYCPHLTFVFVLCWGKGEQEGNIDPPPSTKCWDTLTQVLLDLLVRDGFMCDGKSILFKTLLAAQMVYI